jgi:heme exporter protein D
LNLLAIMTLGPHATFIVLSYAATLIILLALIAWVWLDHRALKRSLSALDAQGVTRRSARPGR